MSRPRRFYEQNGKKRWAKPKKRKLGKRKNAMQRSGKIRVSAMQRIARRDGRKCAYCGTRYYSDEHLDTATLDHYVPVDAGGPDTLGNLRIACWPCNQRKGNLDPRLFSLVEGRWVKR